MTEYKKIKTTLTIAGSDSCGGAGIQADIKTITMNGVYAMSVITALTAQNTLGVKAIAELTPEFLKAQLDAVFEDIFPDSIKVGMVYSKELIKVISDAFERYKAKNIVIDPVMISTSGSALINTDAVNTLLTQLLPLSTLVTPNIPEAEALSDIKINNSDDMIKSAELINRRCGCSVLLKGGHCIGEANDLLYEKGNITWFRARRINNTNTHGTGCTLSSAIASNLAKELSLKDSVEKAKSYITDALNAGLDLGRGSGPLMHNFGLNTKYSR